MQKTSTTYLGVPWRVPTFWQFTSASIMSLGLGLLLAGVAARVDSAFTGGDFAGLVAAVWWPLAARQFGLDPRAGRRAAALHVAGWLLLVGVCRALL